MSLPLRRTFPAVTAAAGIAALYLYNLGAVGVLGPDEPRYAAIGRAMAATGDLITPKLWGSPWFEKPPLLYWMTALGMWAGLGPEMSGRLPVVLLSLLFLLGSFLFLRREFGDLSAGLAVLGTATSAGWLAYSGLCLTDIPVAVCFAVAVWLALPLVDRESGVRWRLALIGVAIGLGALAKGLVPIALAVPFAWFLRRHWRSWWIAIAACLVVALPWYLAVYARNGYPFIEQFFIRHHFERLYSKSLQHVQPWWYYVPVLLLGLFPWTPLLYALFGRSGWDERRKFLASVVLFGLVMFSVSLNKLPGYLLPLIPALFALIGSRIEFIRKRWMFGCALLMGVLPLLRSVLPESLANGKFTWAAISVTRPEWFYILVPVFVVWFARRSWLPILLALCVVADGIYLKATVDPVLDQRVSARVLWKTTVAPVAPELCDTGVNRDWGYGLSFYYGRAIPFCWDRSAPYQLRALKHSLPVVVAK